MYHMAIKLDLKPKTQNTLQTVLVGSCCGVVAMMNAWLSFIKTQP